MSQQMPIPQIDRDFIATVNRRARRERAEVVGSLLRGFFHRLSRSAATDATAHATAALSH